MNGCSPHVYVRPSPTVSAGAGVFTTGGVFRHAGYGAAGGGDGGGGSLEMLLLSFATCSACASYEKGHSCSKEEIFKYLKCAATFIL